MNNRKNIKSIILTIATFKNVVETNCNIINKEISIKERLIEDTQNIINQSKQKIEDYKQMALVCKYWLLLGIPVLIVLNALLGYDLGGISNIFPTLIAGSIIIVPVTIFWSIELVTSRKKAKSWEENLENSEKTKADMENQLAKIKELLALKEKALNEPLSINQHSECISHLMNEKTENRINEQKDSSSKRLVLERKPNRR